ncbi:helix-turn-helix domain-containing protein [Cognatiyoonia sp. IB215182]|nr:helix-turn-helix domain-containing protein [Cognatiyoonia sp. IB215182]MDX8353943.1 helix-turn-helix domain-containing protein [Cognatiyoonia sp. IB215182]
MQTVGYLYGLADPRANAKARGTSFGPKPKLTEHQKKIVLARRSDGDSCRSIAKDMGVSHSTISRLKDVR